MKLTDQTTCPVDALSGSAPESARFKESDWRLPAAAQVSRWERHWLVTPGSFGYVAAIGSSLIVTLLATPFISALNTATIMVLFVLSVMMIAVKYGTGPTLLATVCAVTVFDFFFVEPRFSLSVASSQYLVTFAAMLAVGFLTVYLASSLRYQAAMSALREQRTRALYEFARDLSGVLQLEQICESTRCAIENTFRATSLLLLPDEAGQLRLPSVSRDANPQGLHLSVLDLGIAQWAFDNTRPSGAGTTFVPSSGYSFLPLVAPMRVRGVLAIRIYNAQALPMRDQSELLQAFAALSAIALERVHYIEVAQEASMRAESERLRNALLAALSHDLRTPLTSLAGLSESLAMSRPALTPGQNDMAQALHNEALRMCRSVENLLEMAKMQSGNLSLNLQWHSVEEVVGSSLRATASSLTAHHIHTTVPTTLPLVQFDAMLIERVLTNLLENAAKYAPPGTDVTVSAGVDGKFLVTTVSDSGPGLPPGDEISIFEKFVRGNPESSQPGIGLGLSICKSIIEAHNGHIRAETLLAGGACFRFTLPLGEPPALPESENGTSGGGAV